MLPKFVMLCSLALGIESVEPPDLQVTKAKVEALERNQATIERLLEELKPFAIPLAKRQRNQRLSESVDENLDRAVGRAIILCKLQTAYDEAIDNRLILDAELKKYTNWLILANDKVVGAARMDPQELKREMLELKSRWKVLAHLECRRLKQTLRSLSPESSEARSCEERIDALEIVIGDYEFIFNRAAYEGEYTSGYTASKQEAEKDRIAKQFREKKEQFKDANEGAGQFSREDLLDEHYIEALDRADELVNATKRFPDDAMIIASNSIHLADALESIEDATGVISKNLQILEYHADDAKHVGKLETVFSADELPHTSDEDLNEIIKLFEN